MKIDNNIVWFILGTLYGCANSIVWFLIAKSEAKNGIKKLE